MGMGSCYNVTMHTVISQKNLAILRNLNNITTEKLIWTVYMQLVMLSVEEGVEQWEDGMTE